MDRRPEVFRSREDLEARKRYAAQRDALVQKALGERVKELSKPKDGDEKKDGDGQSRPRAGSPYAQHDAQLHRSLRCRTSLHQLWR
jgi:hypothetical protein